MPIVVLDVDDSNAEGFRDLIMRQPCVVRFHMEGCGHCTAMEPAWRSAIEELMDRSDLEGGIIDFNSRAMSHVPSSIQTAVEGFPTILSLNVGGNIAGNFNGPREKEPLKQFSSDHLKIQKKYNKSKKKRSKKTRSRRIGGGGKKKSKRRKRTKSIKKRAVTSKIK